MEQIFHNYTLWEDYKNGMWRILGKGPERDELLKKAIEFTGDYELYGSFMLRVIREWPFACDQNLSNKSINRRAWIGHSACSLAINCPEDVTREAWHFLTEKQQDDANAQADNAIKIWETEIYKCQKED